MTYMYSKLNESSESIIQPGMLNIDLMEHQKRSIYAMNKLETDGNITCRYRYFYNTEKDLQINTEIGILGDKVGAGKTYMILGLICLNKKIADTEQTFSSRAFIQIKSKDNESIKTNSNLIIVPNKLISQWASCSTSILE